jgi:hypothetical protein
MLSAKPNSWFLQALEEKSKEALALKEAENLTSSWEWTFLSIELSQLQVQGEDKAKSVFVMTTPRNQPLPPHTVPAHRKFQDRAGC